MSRLSVIFFFLSGLSLVAFGVIRFLLGAWIPFFWVLLALFVGFLSAALWIDRKFYFEFLSTKTTKQGMSMGAMIGLVLIFLTTLNFIAVRKNKTFDFSAAKLNTLSDQSIKVVKDLKDTLTVYYFYKDGTENVETFKRMFIDLIKKYQDQTDKLKLEFVEINQRPDLSDKFKVKQSTQVVILDYQGRQGRIEKIDEQELTSAIVKISRTTSRKIYILSGHQELAQEFSNDGNSISQMKELLKNNSYNVEEFSFTTAPTVPKDADVLIIPGPRMNFLDVEVNALKEYLKNGGSVVLGLEPGFKTGLEDLLKSVGVVSKNNMLATVAMTPFGLAVDPRFARGSVFTGHQITKPFGKNEFTVFRLPSALTKVDPLPPGITVEEIIKTNQGVQAFKDNNFKTEGEKGPFTIGVAVKGKLTSDAKSEFHLLVFGDAEFMNEQYLYQNLNRDLVLNSVAFLAKEESQISITPKEIMITKMEMAEGQFALFVFGFVIPLPLLLFVSSGVLWYRRRYS